ncbi:MAG: pyridoxamine 5'-phosphate oxidase family protein, partial [Clostridiales bacterium]|nr:pyridoxamine 5'-phosphate oxidase family protein [Clostridiales bacterium]
LPDVFSVRYESAMAFGTAHIVYGEDERIAALQRLCRKYAPQKTQEQLATYMNKLIVHTTVVRLDVEYISGKSSAQ